MPVLVAGWHWMLYLLIWEIASGGVLKILASTRHSLLMTSATSLPAPIPAAATSRPPAPFRAAAASVSPRSAPPASAPASRRISEDSVVEAPSGFGVVDHGFPVGRICQRSFVTDHPKREPRARNGHI
eukprot:694511_1